jgi:TP901-1 family phage major tail protein
MNGSLKILYLYSNTEWFPIGCLTSNSISESSETLSSTTRDNTDGWTSAVPTNQSYSISFDGILTEDDRGGTVITYGEIKALKRNRTQIQWKIAMSDGSGDTDAGYGYITSIGESANIDEFISFSGQIIGVGDPSIESWTPPTYDDIIDMIPIYDAAK